MGIIWWIILIIWLLSIVSGLVSFAIWKFLEEEDAKTIFMISLCVFLVIPVMILIAFIFGVTVAFNQGIQNMLN